MYFKSFPWHSLWPMDYLEMCCLVSNALEIFLLFSCYWYLIWFHYGWGTHSALFHFSSSTWGFLHSPGRGLLGVCSMGTWNPAVVRCSVLRIWIDLVGLIELFCPSISLLIVCLTVLSILERKVEVSTIIVSISFISIKFCFTYLAAQLFGAYVFRTAMCSCLINTFILI